MATDVQALFTELHGYLQRESYQKAIDTCNKIRSKTPNDDDAIRVKCQCLLRLGKYDKALEIAAKVDGLVMEQAYCLYKLKQVESALEVLASFPEPKTKSMLHLEAQAHYRLSNFDASIRIYESLLSSANAAEDTVELKTNLLAAYISAGRGAELLQRTIDVEESYEIAFNKSFVSLQSNDVHGAQEFLRHAEGLCRETLKTEGYTAEEIDQETDIIRVQEAYIAQLQGNEVLALESYRRVAKSEGDAGLVAIAQNNIATIQRSKDTFDSLKRLKGISQATLREKCTSSQHEAVLANTALLLVLMHKSEEAIAALDNLAQLFPASEYLAPIQLHLALQDEDNSSLASLAESLRLNKSTSGLLCLAHIHCRLGHLAKAADTLRQIPVIQHSPGTVATLVALYDAALDTKSSSAVVEAALSSSSTASATLLEGDGVAKLNRGQYAAAANSFARLLDESGHDIEPEMRVRCLAYLVVALSFQDPAAAAIRVSTLPTIESSDVSVEELVKRAPRPKAQVVQVLSAVLTPKEKKKKAENRERVLRKRAKRKANYIASLKAKPDYNPLIGLVNPDPERWIPRKQRNRRGRKNRGKFVGAQGSGMGSQKDTLKLDAAARAAAKKSAPTLEKGVLVTDGPSMNRKARKRR